MSAPEDDHVCQEVAGARVHASPDLTAEGRAAIAQVVEAARARYARENAPVRHTLATVAAGGPLYPPVEVRLTPVEGQVRGTVEVQLRVPGTQRHVHWSPSLDTLADPCRLSDALEAMLRTLCPLPNPGQLP